MYSDRRGTDKTTLNETFQTKITPDKTPQTRIPATKTNLPVKTYVCMHVLLKIGGVLRCVTYFRGGPEMSDRGWGIEIGPK